MKFFDTIIKFLFKGNLQINTKIKYKLLITNTIGVLFSILIIFTSLKELYAKSNLVFLIVNAVIFVGIIVNLIYLQQNKKNYQFPATLNLIYISLFLLTMLFLGKVNSSNILWYSSFPIISILLLKRKGNLISTLFLIIVSVTLFLPFFESYQTEISLLNKIVFIFSYLSVFIIIYLLKQSIVSIIQKHEEDISQVVDELKDKEDFISRVSHQIRTPLNNIVVVSNMINPNDLEDKQKDYFDTILASTNNLVDVVNSFSDITNVDVQERKKYQIQFDLNHTLKNTINLFVDKDSENKENIILNSEIDYPLLGDPVKVKQIFLNLIEQILKNSELKKRSININLVEDKIHNNSVEINFQLITSSLSDFFNKLSNKKDLVHELEINIAQRTIESLGSKLLIEQQNSETKFEFLLTFEKASQKQKEAQETIGKTGEQKALNLEDANVLLVEDNLINQKIVLLSLKKVVKNVDVANNGKEALDKFGSVKYDIILMDIQMPIMNGIVTTKKIRNIEKSTNTHTPIIAITANALLGDKEECLAAGTDDYISKPFQIETLLNKMKDLLKQ
jgi:CheY-like chemotaxis protein